MHYRLSVWPLPGKRAFFEVERLVHMFTCSRFYHGFVFITDSLSTICEKIYAQNRYLLLTKQGHHVFRLLLYCALPNPGAGMQRRA